MALLVSCARYHPLTKSPETSAAAFDTRSLAGDPGLSEFLHASLHTAPPEWSLTSLTMAALYYQPELEVARYRLDVALAAARTAGQTPNPSLAASAFYNLDIVHPSPWTAGMAVNFLVETFGKRGARTEQACALADAARADIATAGWQVRGRVREAMLALWSARGHLILSQRQAELQHQLTSLAAQRLAAGSGTTPDLVRQQIFALRTDATVAEQIRAEQQAHSLLAQAVGVPLRALDGLNISTAVFDAPPPIVILSDLRRHALTRRSDVAAGMAEYRAAEAGLRLQVAGQYPSLVIGPGANTGNLDGDRSSSQLGVPFALELPVFNQNQGPIAEAVAHRHQAAAALTATQANIAAAVDGAVGALASARQAESAGDAALAAFRQSDMQAYRALQEGAADRPTRLAATLAMEVAEQSVLDARLSELQALGRLEDAAQQPLFEPVLWPTDAMTLPAHGPGSAA